MRRIKFDMGELMAFVVTAEKQSFRLAADALFVSPSALSRRVERLEAAVGAQLLARTTRQVEPDRRGPRLPARGPGRIGRPGRRGAARG